MSKIIAVFCLACSVLCAGCMGAKPEAAYTGTDQAVLVGKADCLISVWFSDRQNKAKLDLYRLQADGGEIFVATIGSDYSVLAIPPGIYGLSKTHFQVDTGLRYKDEGYIANGKPNHAPFFEPRFWQLTEIEQAIELPKLETHFFGIIKVEAGDTLYYGNLTLDTVTNRRAPMIVESRTRQAAEQALKAAYPARSNSMKDANFVGPAFLLGKVRESRS